MKKFISTTCVASICSIMLFSAYYQNEATILSNSTASLVQLADNPVAFSASLTVGTRDIMVNYKGSNPKVKLQITGSNGVTYTYNLHGGYETFPLSSGDGSYKVAVYENVTGNQYSTALSQTFKVTITNIFGPNLYPNQYVNFHLGSQVVAQSMLLAQSCNSDLEVVTKVYNYVTSTISYDHAKAATVQSGYTSNVDEIMLSGTGIVVRIFQPD